MPGEAERSRAGRHRRPLAPRQARGAPGAGRRPVDGRRRHDLPALAASARSSCTRSRRAQPSASGLAGAQLVLDVTAAYTVLGLTGPEARDAALAADPPPPLPVRRRGRARHGARAAGRRRLPDRRRAGARPLPRRGRARLRARARRRARRRRRAAAGGAAVKDIFLRRRVLPEPRRAQAALRRRDRRRRLARPRDRVLPRALPRHHERRDPREELHRLGRRRPEHDHHPCRTTARRRARRSTRRASTLYEKLSAELDFNLMFSQHGHFTLAHSDRSLVVQHERAEVNKLLGIDEPRDRPRRGEAALPPDQRRRGRHLADPRRAVPPAGRDHPPRRRRLGLREAGRARRGIEIHQGVEVTGFDVRDGRCHGVRTTKGDISLRRRRERDRGLVEPGREARRRFACRSRRRSCRRSSPSP